MSAPIALGELAQGSAGRRLPLPAPSRGLSPSSSEGSGVVGEASSARAAALLPASRIPAARVGAGPGRRRRLARVRGVAAEMLRGSRLGLLLRLGRLRRRCLLCRHAVRVALRRDGPVPSLRLDRAAGHVRCVCRVSGPGAFPGLDVRRRHDGRQASIAEAVLGCRLPCRFARDRPETAEWAGWIRTPLLRGLFLVRSTHRCTHSAGMSGRHDRFSLPEKADVVGFAAVAEDVRVPVGGHTQLALADEPADLRPGASLPVQEADPPVAEVVR